MIAITDLTAHVCSVATPIRDVLLRLDQSPFQFQIVLDGQGRLVGTITDGDVRRAILQGVAFEEPASACMQTRPKVGRQGDIRGNQMRLVTVGSSRAFLPVVDADGVVVELLVREDLDTGIAQALVMAGGYGKRLGERTQLMPKPLLPVGGKPILDHVLSSLEAAGARRIYVSVHYRADQVRQFLGQRDNQAEMRVVSEAEPLGTAGALGLIEDLMHAPLLVVNGDVITDVDFATVHDFHVRHALDATIGVTRYDVDIPFGVVRYDKDGLFDGIDEKPRISNYIAAGVYYLSPELVRLVPANHRMDMPDLLNQGRAIGQSIGLFPIHEYWTDVGRPHDLEAADAKKTTQGARPD